MAAAARRVRARVVAKEQMCRQLAKAKAREERQRSIERAASLRSAASAARRSEEDKEVAAQAAATRATAAAEALAVKLAREVLSAHAPSSADVAERGAVSEATVAEVVSTARALCKLLRDEVQRRAATAADGQGADTQVGSDHQQGADEPHGCEASIVSLPLAARWVACYRTQASVASPSSPPPSPPPVLVVFHGTRAELVPSITREGLRLPDGRTVRHSTALSLMRGAPAARIFATLNFSRAALHATAPVEPSAGANYASLALVPYAPSVPYTPSYAPTSSRASLASPRSPAPRPAATPGEQGSGAGAGSSAGTGSVFLLLALPGAGSSPCDHAKSTYMFAEEAMLLPCFLPAGVHEAQRMAEWAVQAAMRVLRSRGSESSEVR